MLYGYTKNGTTVVTAAETVMELEGWYQRILEKTPNNVTEHRATGFMDHLSDPDFLGYRHPAYIFEHDSADQQDDFITQNSIKIFPPMRARDFMLDMVAKVDDKLQSDYHKRDNRTIGEVTGLDEHDPFDKRSEAERETAKLNEKRTDELRKRLGDHVTGQSFDPNPRGGDGGGLNITEIFDAGGAINVKGMKFGPGTNGSAPKIEKQKVEYDLTDDELNQLVDKLQEVGYTPEQLEKLKGQFDLTDNEHRQALAEVAVEELKSKKVHQALAPIPGVTEREEVIETVQNKLDAIEELTDEERGALMEGVIQKLDTPTPKPGDYRFALDHELTAEPAMRGAGTPIFVFGKYTFGPNEGKFGLSDLGLLFPPGDVFDMVSGSIYEYTGPGTADDAVAHLVSRGFLEDPSVLGKKADADIGSKSNGLMPTPEDFAKALAGNGTSTVDGTDSWGREAVGIVDHAETDLIEPGIKGEVGAVLEVTDGLRKVKADELDPMIKNALGKDFQDLEDAGKQIKIGRYNGIAIAGNQVMFPETPDYKIRNDLTSNVRDHGGVSFNGVTVRVFTRSNERYRGIVVYEGEKDILIISV